MAIDKDAIIKDVYQGAGQAAKNLDPADHLVLQRQDRRTTNTTPRRPRRCSRRPASRTLEIDLWYMPVQRPYNPNAKRMAEMMQADLAKVGVNAKLVTYEWGEYRKRLQAGEHLTGLLGWTGDNGDPDNFFFLLGCTATREGGQNISKWCNKEFDDRLIKARSSPTRPSAPSSTRRCR